MIEQYLIRSNCASSLALFSLLAKRSIHLDEVNGKVNKVTRPTSKKKAISINIREILVGKK